MTLPRDLIPGLIIIIVCAGLYYVTTTFDSDPLGAAQGMPATHMPRLILGVIGVLTLFMIGQGLRQSADDTKASPSWRMWATAAILGGAAAGFTVMGVPLAFFAVCVAIPLLWGARNLPAIGIFAVALSAAIYVVFQLLLGLRLPMGPLAALGF